MNFFKKNVLFVSLFLTSFLFFFHTILLFSAQQSLIQKENECVADMDIDKQSFGLEKAYSDIIMHVVSFLNQSAIGHLACTGKELNNILRDKDNHVSNNLPRKKCYRCIKHLQCSQRSMYRVLGKIYNRTITVTNEPRRVTFEVTTKVPHLETIEFSQSIEKPFLPVFFETSGVKNNIMFSNRLMHLILKSHEKLKTIVLIYEYEACPALELKFTVENSHVTAAWFTLKEGFNKLCSNFCKKKPHAQFSVKDFFAGFVFYTLKKDFCIKTLILKAYKFETNASADFIGFFPFLQKLVFINCSFEDQIFFEKTLHHLTRHKNHPLEIVFKNCSTKKPVNVISCYKEMGINITVEN